MLELLRIIGSTLAISEAPWRQLLANAASLPLTTTLVVVLLAGLSESVSQSIVLVLNKVKFRRFCASLLLNGIIFVLGYVFYVLSIGVATRLLFDVAQTPLLLSKSVALAYAPLILSFITLMPYFGRALRIVLNVYHFAAIVVAVRVIHNFSDLQAIESSLAGLVLFILLHQTLGYPAVRFGHWLQDWVAGVQLKPAAELVPRYTRADESSDDKDRDDEDKG